MRIIITSLLVMTVSLIVLGQSEQQEDSAKTLKSSENVLIGHYIRTYPNPTNGPIAVELQREYENVKLEVRSIHGKLAMIEKFKRTSKISTETMALPAFISLKLPGTICVK